MRTLLHFLLVSIISLVLIQENEAQSNQKISIQGIVKNGSGGAVPDLDYSLTFTLYDAATGGNVVWTETQPAVKVTGGVYSALLGLVVDFSAVAFDEPYFLGVKVGSDPELTPRTEMTYAPYALAVDKIKSSVSTGNSFSSTGNVGIGTNAPLNKLTIVDSLENALTIKTPDNTLNNGIAFQNSGTAYTWNIRRDDVGGNQADLVISGGNAEVSVTALPERLRIKQSDGTVDIKGNIQIRGGTPAIGKVLTATDAIGNATWQSAGNSVVYLAPSSSTTELSGPAVVAASNGNALVLSGYTNDLSVNAGDVITMNASFFYQLGAGTGQDGIYFYIAPEGQNGCPTDPTISVDGLPNVNLIAGLPPYNLQRDRFADHTLMGSFTTNCTGTIRFALLGAIVQNSDDAMKFLFSGMTVRKN